MINVKDQVFAALLTVSTQVSDVYPTSWASFPSIQYTEEQNNVYEWTNNREQLSYLRYRVDIWDQGSTSTTALAVDEALIQIGLKRIECQDVPDPSGLRHKQMRYEAIIDVNDESIYWTGNR